MASNLTRQLSGTLPQIMGILNVTPDSFSDGGDYLTVGSALAQARRMVTEGASIIDIGGESTRPGATPVSAKDQLARTVPVIDALHAAFKGEVGLSIDTRDAEVAAGALASGATMINDISGGADPAMFELAARHRVPIVLMHMQGLPATMQDGPHYDDVVAEILEFLSARAAQAIASGVPPANIIIDPGIGFGKTRQHNLEILTSLSAFVGLGYTVMLGTSRKRFMGAICRETDPKELVGATCATTVIGTQAGVSIFRVHDVRENRQAIEVARALREASAR